MSLYPRISASDVARLADLLRNPTMLDHPECPYATTLKQEIRKLLELTSQPLSVTEVVVGHTPSGIPTGPLTEDQMLALLDRGMLTLETVMNATDGSEASKVSAAKNLFDLMEKRIALMSELNAVSDVWKMVALVKELFTRLPDPKLSAEFLKRLEEIRND
jgi:hypothetical protein